MILNQWNNLKTFAVVGSLALSAGTALAAEDYATWTYNADVTLNTSSTGAAVAGTVTGFPVLVRLSYRNFLFNEAKGNGADIRFGKAGLPLSYHVERWDSAAEAADIWVKMDTVLGNTAGQVIKMYWGKADAMDSSKASAVFDTANGFAAVYNMNQDPATGKVLDLTKNALDGTPNSLVTGDLVPGYIGKGINFNGTSANVNIGKSPIINFSTAFTFSGWINMSEYETGDEGGLLQKPGSIRYFIRGENDDARKRTHGIYFGASMGTIKTSSTPLPLSEWHHFTFTTDGSAYSFYTDGLADGSGVLGEAILDNTENVVISDAHQNSRQAGVYDEFRIDRVMRSADWVKLSYANQKAYQSLVTIPMTSRCVASFTPPRDTSMNEGTSLVLNSSAPCASNISWSVQSGPATSLPDSLDKTLKLKLPRVTGNATLVLRLVATFPAGPQQKDITIQIKEVSPDPVFTFPTGLTWNGTDTMSIVPIIPDLAAIKASPYPNINWVWSIPLSYADTAAFDGGMLLRNGYDGELQLNLCLDNGGPVTCKTVSIAVAIPVSLALRPHRNSSLVFQPRFDIMGRRTVEKEKTSRLGRPLFLLPERSQSGTK